MPDDPVLPDEPKEEQTIDKERLLRRIKRVLGDFAPNDAYLDEQIQDILDDHPDEINPYRIIIECLIEVYATIMKETGVWVDSTDRIDDSRLPEWLSRWIEHYQSLADDWDAKYGSGTSVFEMTQGASRMTRLVTQSLGTRSSDSDEFMLV